jgi:hypothetical protein
VDESSNQRSFGSSDLGTGACAPPIRRRDRRRRTARPSVRWSPCVCFRFTDQPLAVEQNVQAAVAEPPVQIR